MVDPQLSAMAQALGVQPPSGGAWLEQFQLVAEQLPVALMICDMTVPGIAVQWTNAAGEQLVGYSKAEHVGKNCRFMQGKRTEAAAVRAMVKGIRAAEQTTVRVTNYKKDGSQFVNVLTLHPVHDSTGAYRYSIGLQSDGARAAQESQTLERVRAVLPRVFDVASQPTKFDAKLTKVDDAAQRKQWRVSMAKFTRLVWSLDWESSLRQLMALPVAQNVFGQWLQQHHPDDLVQLQLLVGAVRIAQMPHEQAAQATVHMCQQITGTPPASAEEAMSTLQGHAQSAEQMLAGTAFPKFVQSKSVRRRAYRRSACLLPGLGALWCRTQAARPVTPAYARREGSALPAAWRVRGRGYHGIRCLLACSVPTVAPPVLMVAVPPAGGRATRRRRRRHADGRCPDLGQVRGARGLCRLDPLVRRGGRDVPGVHRDQ